MAQLACRRHFLSRSGAFNSQNNLLYWMFGVAVCAVMIGGVISGSSMMGLEVRREIASTPGGATIHAPLRGPQPAPLAARGGRCDRGDRRASGLATCRITPGRRRRHALRPARAASSSPPADRLARGEAPLELVRVTTCFPFGLAQGS
ncbi:MAG: hypothetical protein R3B49_11650 [Phycisphaerales bacterium]